MTSAEAVQCACNPEVHIELLVVEVMEPMVFAPIPTMHSVSVHMHHQRPRQISHRMHCNARATQRSGGKLQQHHSTPLGPEVGREMLQRMAVRRN